MIMCKGGRASGGDAKSSGCDVTVLESGVVAFVLDIPAVVVVTVGIATVFAGFLMNGSWGSGARRR